jgi:hypothetical protein
VARIERTRWLWLLLLLLVALAIALVAAFAGNGGGSHGSHDNDVAAPLSSAPASKHRPAGTGAVKGAQAALTAGGQLFSGSTNVLALGDAAQTRLVGHHVRGVNVQVSSLAGNDGFWVGGGANRMLVHVDGGAHVKVGELVRFHGTIARAPGGAKAGTSVRVDVAPSSLQRVSG